MNNGTSSRPTGPSPYVPLTPDAFSINNRSCRARKALVGSSFFVPASAISLGTDSAVAAARGNKPVLPSTPEYGPGWSREDDSTAGSIAANTARQVLSLAKAELLVP